MLGRVRGALWFTPQCSTRTCKTSPEELGLTDLDLAESWIYPGVPAVLVIMQQVAGFPSHLHYVSRNSVYMAAATLELASGDLLSMLDR